MASSARKPDVMRKERQDAMREQLRGYGLIQQVIKAIEKSQEDDCDFEKLQKLKFATETRLKLLNKILPDEKFIEITGNLETELTVRVVDLTGDNDRDN